MKIKFIFSEQVEITTSVPETSLATHQGMKEVAMLRPSKSTFCLFFSSMYLNKCNIFCLLPFQTLEQFPHCTL